jgi:hypothetical protein
MQHLASLLQHDGDKDKPDPLCRFRELVQHAEVQLLMHVTQEPACTVGATVRVIRLCRHTVATKF